MRLLLFLLPALLLAACARPLTPAERGFADTVHGPALATEPVRIHRGALIGNLVLTRPPRPAVACRERIRPPETGPVATSTAAVVLGNRMFTAVRWYGDDFLAGYPDSLPLDTAMLLAHELTHVWQWQNRATTGYHPLRAAAEHLGADPYLFDLGATPRFADFGWEQQGALVEEFVCCRAMDPDGARTARLHALLAPVFPGIARRGKVPPDAVRLPFPALASSLRGVCA